MDTLLVDVLLKEFLVSVFVQLYYDTHTYHTYTTIYYGNILLCYYATVFICIVLLLTSLKNHV